MKECGDLAHDNLSINVPENGRAELLYSKMMCVVLCFSGREADRGPAGYRPTKKQETSKQQTTNHIKRTTHHHAIIKYLYFRKLPTYRISYHGQHLRPLILPPLASLYIIKYY